MGGADVSQSIPFILHLIGSPSLFPRRSGEKTPAGESTPGRASCRVNRPAACGKFLSRRWLAKSKGAEKGFGWGITHDSIPRMSHTRHASLRFFW